MEYIAADSIPYFTESSRIVEEAGCRLIELQVVPQGGNVNVTAVIASLDPKKDIGVSDCSKVQRALMPALIAFLGKSEDNVYMSVCSPGLERTIRNAAEFSFFTGKEVKVWDRQIGDWVPGTIESSDTEHLVLKTKEGSKDIPYSDIAKAKFLH